MPKIDHINRLTITRVTPKGVLVDAKKLGTLFLREAPTDCNVGDSVSAFIYRDSNDELTATAAKPLVTLGQCAYLKVVSVTDTGAFLDWGLPKDLFLPYAEQAYPIREGASYVVYATTDNTGRMIASTMLHRHLDETNDTLTSGERVDLLIASKSDLGFKAVINNEYLGLIYHDDLSQPLRFGNRMKGWVKAIRPDGKIDLSINTLDKQSRDQLETRILKALQQAEGRMEISDKSSPEVIFSVFNVSKKNFKRALGQLYKQRKILIHPNYIELVKD